MHKKFLVNKTTENKGDKRREITLDNYTGSAKKT